MHQRYRKLVPILCYGLIAGCLVPRPWWERELQAWVGAPVQELETVWGAPRRTIVGESGRPVMVYESTTVIDPVEDRLRAPNQMVSDSPPSSAPQVDERDCSMYFEIEDDVIVEARYDGAGCQVIPRPGLTPRS